MEGSAREAREEDDANYSKHETSLIPRLLYMIKQFLYYLQVELRLERSEQENTKFELREERSCSGASCF